MARKKKNEPELSMYERTGRYEVIEEIETETETIAKLRMYNGATAICHIPKHTPEEEAKLTAKITEAMFRMVYPDRDLSGPLKIIV